MTLLDYRLEITEKLDSPMMPDGRWRYVFSISIDGFDFRSESPKQYCVCCHFVLDGVSQIAYQMVQAGLPDGTIHVRQAPSSLASSLPSDDCCCYRGSYGPISKLALYHAMPHIEHNEGRYHFDVDGRNSVLTSELINDLKTWLKEGNEGFLDYAISYRSMYGEWFALDDDMPYYPPVIPRRRRRHYYVHLLNDCAAVSFMGRWHGDCSMLGKAIDWTRFSKND
jgi:hypothetical protein